MPFVYIKKKKKNSKECRLPRPQTLIVNLALSPQKSRQLITLPCKKPCCQLSSQFSLEISVFLRPKKV